MPKLNKGVAAITAAIEGKGGGSATVARRAGTFTPLWRGLPPGEQAYMLFCTDLDDVEKVALHTFVRVPARREGREFDFEVFASRTRNEDYFSDTHSILEEEMNHWPDVKFAGIALLLDPVYDGKGTRVQNIEGFEVQGRTVTRDDGSEIFYPSWQLIYQSVGNFWANLLSIHNNYGITEWPVIVQRTGERTDTNYTFLPVTSVPQVDISEFAGSIPTIEDEIKRLGSEERYDEYFGPGKPRLKQEQQYPPATKPKDAPAKKAAPVEEVVRTSKPKSRVDFSALDALTEDDSEETTPY